jgi:cyclopropane fatty-acyl-phospholipid synthase-like methyltransferase
MKSWALRLIPIVLAASRMATAQDAVRRDEHQMHGLHNDPKAYIAMLEDPARDGYQKPHEVMVALALREGETVADIGAGSGYFALRLAAHVGEKGTVFAVDIDAEMIRHLNRRIRDAGAWNVRTILAPPDDPLLGDASVDRFFICNTWHHIEDQAGYLALMRKMLRPGGQVIMIDFHKRDLPVGPPASMKIAREDLVRQMENAGFRLIREHTFLPHQYFLVFGPT